MRRILYSQMKGLPQAIYAMKRHLATTVDADGIMIDEREDDSINRIIPLMSIPSVTTAVKPVAIPREQWPTWAKAVTPWAEPEDIGVGDTIHRKLGVLGEVFKATLKTLGVPCGCDQRQEEWNILYPYGGET
jgi:hypothetical protein